MINQFVAPLPETLYEFKSLLNNNFPNICDTKLMANTTPLKEDITDTSLEELLRILLQGKPFDMPDVASGMNLLICFSQCSIWNNLSSFLRKRAFDFTN